MAIPDHELSTNPIIGDFMGGRSDPRLDATHDYESGGIALNDTSQGLMVQVWEAWINGDSEIWIGAPSVPASKIIDDTDITQVSLTFDQNMAPAIAYVAAGTAKLYWYDPLAGSMVTQSFLGITTPRVALDDKRQAAVIGGWNDVIFAYIKDGDLCYRQQRDRYQVEYVLRSPAMSPAIERIGMNIYQRFQFRMYYP